MKKAIVVVSFGTSNYETRKMTIDACENKIKDTFKEYDFFRAYTSNMIIKIIEKNEGLKIDTPSELLYKLYKEGYDEVVVQALHIIDGLEYNKLVNQINEYQDKFKKIVIGRPLLTNIDDCKEVSKIMKYQLPDINDDEVVLLMGHGTIGGSHQIYSYLEKEMLKNNMSICIKTLEESHLIYELGQELRRNNIQKVHLMPFMLVAGKHAIDDMASDEQNSLKTLLKSCELDVEIHLKGLGENPYIQDKFINHANRCI